MDVFLGIDTSCYTTSLCLVDAAYDVVADERIILSVAKGGRGLSQSNMVYQHTRNLPVLFERLAGVPVPVRSGALSAPLLERGTAERVGTNLRPHPQRPGQADVPPAGQPA